jgi:alkanesulfonate monooxygenase SsuD/methylene tetrahydromethanopterin reductase-like flavin-dependent oxidoreductase (luciferase family)
MRYCADIVDTRQLAEQLTDSSIHPWVAEATSRIRFATAGGPLSEPDALLSFTRRAEDLGFDGYWFNDHPARALDPWTVLAAVAVTTSRIRLFPLVSCVLYRSAAQTARYAADVDRLSGGRVVLGLGIGDDPEEFESLGLPYPATPERQRWLERTVLEVRARWGQSGTAPAIAPAPVQRPRVPIMIAGGGERVTLRQVAQYADMCNFGPHEWTGGAYDLASVSRKLAALRRHCDEVGRPYEAVMRSHYTPLVVLAADRTRLADKAATVRPNPRERFVPLVATPDDAVRHYQALAEVGMQYFLANTRGSDQETLELLAEHVLPRVTPGG